MKYIWRFAAGVPIRTEKCHGLDGARRCSQESGRPNVSCATQAREVFFVKVGAERLKALLVLGRTDGVIEVEPLPSHVEMEQDDMM